MIGPRPEPVLRLLDRLRRPVAELPADALAALWRRHRIEIVCERPGDFEDGPGLAQRVRGAWGEQLGHTLVACAPGDGDTTPFRLLDRLFGSTGRLRRDERPKSYVMAA